MDSNALLTFLKKAAEDPALRAELTALAGRHGIDLGGGELSDADLDQAAGGLLSSVSLGLPKLQTSFLSPTSTISHEGIKQTIEGVFKFGDGSV